MGKKAGVPFWEGLWVKRLIYQYVENHHAKMIRSILAWCYKAFFESLSLVDVVFHYFASKCVQPNP